jgi:hypothetical protein
MAGIKPPLPRSYPVLRFASAFAAFLFFFAYATSFLPRLSLSLGAAAPAAMEMQTGVGGGEPEDMQRDQSGGGCDSCTAEATVMAEAPMAPSEKSPPEPLATSAPSEAEKSFSQQDQTGVAESAPVEREPLSLPALSTLQSVMLVVAIFAGLAALIIRLRTERSFAKRNKAG